MNTVGGVRCKELEVRLQSVEEEASAYRHSRDMIGEPGSAARAGLHFLIADVTV